LAGRLHTLLLAATKIQGNTRIRDAWAKLLQVNPTDSPTLLRRLARVLDVPARLASQITEVATAEGQDVALHLRWQSPVSNFLSALNLSEPWSACIGNITGETLQSLEHCADLLHLRRPETIVGAEQLQQIRDSINDLLHEVSEASLDTKIRRMIERHLRAILDALEDYPIHGTPYLEDAVSAATGAIFLNIVHITAASPQDRTMVNKFWEVVRNIAAVIGLVIGVPRLPATIDALLPHAAQHESTPSAQPAPEHDKRAEPQPPTTDDPESPEHPKQV
jgi:ElaB/YqjD/DUF883 family membrane-anchored ribosome-binding protein